MGRRRDLSTSLSSLVLTLSPQQHGQPHRDPLQPVHYGRPRTFKNCTWRNPLILTSFSLTYLGEFLSAFRALLSISWRVLPNYLKEERGHHVIG
jgi:hypothetical protein